MSKQSVRAEGSRRAADRRAVVSALLTIFVPTTAIGQTQPFRLRVVRTSNLSVTLSLNDCLAGQMYLSDDFSISDYGTPLAETLELPYRANNTLISAIPSGIYSGHTREDGPLGWRIELHTPAPRTVIEIHPGTMVKDTEGCILVGRRADTGACGLSDSRATRDQIKALYGNDASRSVEVKIEG